MSSIFFNRLLQHLYGFLRCLGGLRLQRLRGFLVGVVRSRHDSAERTNTSFEGLKTVRRPSRLLRQSVPPLHRQDLTFILTLTVGALRQIFRKVQQLLVVFLQVLEEGRVRLRQFFEFLLVLCLFRYITFFLIFVVTIFLLVSTLFVLILLLVSPTSCTQPRANDARARCFDFPVSIQPLLTRECGECHGDTLAEGGFRTDSYGAVLAAEVVAQGLLTELDPGSAKVGDNTEWTAKHTLIYYKLVIGGVEEIEIDVLNNVWRVGVVDRMADIRAALQQ